MNSLLVYNLPQSFETFDLEDLFSMVGNVVTARIVRDPEGTATGRGAVEMSTGEEAKNCILYFHRHAVNGMKLSVVLDNQLAAGAGA